VQWLFDRYLDGGMMKNKRIILLFRWTARVLAIGFSVFISVFALDVFSEKNWLIPLLIHLIPSYIIVVITAIAWKYEKIGGIIFITAGIVMLISSRFEAYVVSVPAIVIGGLFLATGFMSKNIN
jgi:hypothetical protein